MREQVGGVGTWRLMKTVVEGLKFSSSSVEDKNQGLDLILGRIKKVIYPHGHHLQHHVWTRNQELGANKALA